MTRSAIAAAFASCATFGALLPSVPAGVSGGDTAEAQTVPYILGIAHSTGFPAYTLIGWVWSHAIPISTPAWRMNAFSLLCIALTAGLVVLLARALGSNPVAAVAAALLFAFGPVVRADAVEANAHALGVLFAVLTIVTAVRFAQTGERRLVVASCLCAGLGLATHPDVLWTLPGIGVAVVWQRRRLHLRTAALACCALVAPLALYGYFPIRSAIVAAQHLDPAAGPPIGGAVSLDWDTNHPRTLDGFLDEVLARQVHASGAVRYIGNVGVAARVGTLWRRYGMAQYAWWLLLLALAGTVALAVRERRGVSVVLAGSVLGVWFAGIYLGDQHITWYIITAFAAIAALAAAASTAVLPRVPRIAIDGLTIGALAAAIAAGWTQRFDPGHGPVDGQAIVDAVARDVPGRAIVVAPWFEAAALGYGAAVEHALGQRIVVSGWPADYLPDYAKWSAQRPVIVYTGGAGIVTVLQLPRNWLDELPSSQLYYHVFRIEPPHRGA